MQDQDTHTVYSQHTAFWNREGNIMYAYSVIAQAHKMQG